MGAISHCAGIRRFLRVYVLAAAWRRSATDLGATIAGRSLAPSMGCRFSSYRHAPPVFGGPKGLMTGTPAGSKWRVLRVTTVRPCSKADAAMRRS